METKTCAKCTIIKSVTEFHKSRQKKDGLQPYCKTCLINNSKRDYRENDRKRTFDRRKQYAIRVCKKFVDELRSNLGCCSCPERETCCIDFHHLNSKTDEISNLLRKNSKKRLMAELLKCVPICSNCHRKVHAGKKTVSENYRVTLEQMENCPSFAEMIGSVTQLVE